MIAFLLSFFLVASVNAESPVIRIGSKNFTENYILAEILAQILEKEGIRVERHFGMGGTGILFEALKHGEIDVYPEYTGTLGFAILGAGRELGTAEIEEQLSKMGLMMSSSLGFNNSYGLAVTPQAAKKFGLRDYSDLKAHPELRMSFSYEFMEREDGFRALIKAYGLNPKAPQRMDHALTYASLSSGSSDVAEIYTTDAKIEKYGLVVLNDDLEFFPDYHGVFVYRSQAGDQLASFLAQLEDSLDDNEMIRLNSLVENSGATFATAAANFLAGGRGEIEAKSRFWPGFWRQTKRHLLLVLIPTLISIMIGVPMGICAAKMKSFGQGFLMLSGLIQTIPSLALLCFLIPLFGIGLTPALIALTLYGLLPIVRSTHGGLVSIDPRFSEMARVLGLSRFQTLRRIELPMASVSILSGIKTAAVINVGMATLAAFIGAGGYGSMIVTGLALNNSEIILQGAIPAAVMAVVVHFLFEFTDRWLVPRGLR